MQGFYGMRLVSRRYGEGILKEWNGKTVTVKFAEKTVRCWFPKAFECGELTATNEQDALRVREAIDGWMTSLIERLKGPLSARVLSQKSLACMVERVGKILHGCYPAEEIEQRLLAYRETLGVSEKEPGKEAEKEIAETPATPFRAFLRKHAKLFAILPLIGMGILGAICILAPLGAVSQIAGIGLGTGYDYLKVMSAAFEAGVHIPVILSIVYAGILIFGALSVFVLPQRFGKMGYDIFGLTVSFATFATGVGQAAWVGTTGVKAGAFPILLIVFGILFAAYYATLTAFRKIFHGELAVAGKGLDDNEYGIFMLLTPPRMTAPANAKKKEKIYFECPADDPSTGIRGLVRKYAKIVAILPLIFMATFGAILVLAPLASVSQMAGIGLGTGYDYLKTMTAAFEAGVHIPILLAILFAAALIFGALSVFVLPRLRGGKGYDIFGIAMSASAFIVGVAQAAWVGTTGVSAGGFSILLIVFGLFFCALHTAVLVLRLKFIGSLPIRL